PAQPAERQLRRRAGDRHRDHPAEQSPAQCRTGLQRRAPLFFNLFAGNQAAHMTLLGMTGFGKTFFLNLLTLRSAVVMGTRVIGIDDFDNGPRIAGAAGAGATCYMLSMDTPINILDVVYDEDAEGGWLTNQVQHAIGQLALLLGRPGKSMDGKER